MATQGFEVIDPNLLPVKVVLDGTEELIFINPSTKRLEKAVLDGFEVRSNKAGDFLIIDDVKYPTTKAVDDRFTSEKGTTIATLDGAGKLPLSQLPDIAITSVIVATETSIADFALNNANYTFEQGDVILIDDGGNVTHYLFIGGDKLDVNEYSQISASQVTIGQVVGLQTALDSKLNVIDSPFITLNTHLFRILKNPNNNNPLNKKTLELNDFVSMGFYTGNVIINSAKYNGSGSINDFGTDINNYQDGSYTNVDFSRLS